MVAVERPRLLVTTALEAKFGAAEDLLLLGEWCKRYERGQLWEHRRHEVIPFHWDDREKLQRDYFYLEALHERILAGIAASLNAIHGTDHDTRYWQILLDPWLLSYLGTTFDRWECLRNAFDTQAPIEMVWIDQGDRMAAPFSYTEFLNNSLSDDWNQGFYQRIVRDVYGDRCTVRHAGADEKSEQGSSVYGGARAQRNLRGRVTVAVERLLGALVSHYDVAFVGSTFGMRELLRLNVRLGQLPRLFLPEFGSPLQERDLPPLAEGRDLRTELNIDFHPDTPFEEFVGRWIARDLPRSVVERYADLRDRARGIGVHARVIVTASNHWGDVLAKAWFAEQVRAGAKLVIAEHGGSLPSFRELFGFEVAIADVKVTWFRAYDPKHCQLPPAKIVGRFTLPSVVRDAGAESKYCALIGSECARWVHRVHFYPMAGQWSELFDMALDFHSRLDAPVAAQLRVKPYPSDQGWNTRARFIDALGPTKVFPKKSLDEVFAEARLIVCTYPETTFAEAMASGVPTILMYPPRLYELHDVALPLLECLMDANLAFQDAESAAAHVNAIWEHPERWWNDAKVVAAREEFFRQALKLDGDWCQAWTGMLQSLIADPLNSR